MRRRRFIAIGFSGPNLQALIMLLTNRSDPARRGRVIQSFHSIADGKLISHAFYFYCFPFCTLVLCCSPPPPPPPPSLQQCQPGQGPKSICTINGMVWPLSYIITIFLNVKPIFCKCISSRALVCGGPCSIFPALSLSLSLIPLDQLASLSLLVLIMLSHFILVHFNEHFDLFYFVLFSIKRISLRVPQPIHSNQTITLQIIATRVLWYFLCLKILFIQLKKYL